MKAIFLKSISIAALVCSIAPLMHAAEEKKAPAKSAASAHNELERLQQLSRFAASLGSDQKQQSAVQREKEQKERAAKEREAKQRQEKERDADIPHAQRQQQEERQQKEREDKERDAKGGAEG